MGVGDIIIAFVGVSFIVEVEVIILVVMRIFCRNRCKNYSLCGHGRVVAVILIIVIVESPAAAICMATGCIISVRI